MKTADKKNEKKSSTTRELLNRMTEIQMEKIEKFHSNYRNKAITQESELAMQNMIEILKFRYEVLQKSQK